LLLFTLHTCVNHQQQQQPAEQVAAAARAATAATEVVKLQLFFGSD